jgi:peroxidase
MCSIDFNIKRWTQWARWGLCLLVASMNPIQDVVSDPRWYRQGPVSFTQPTNPTSATLCQIGALPFPFTTPSGLCHQLDNPLVGKTLHDYKRLGDPVYKDGVGVPVDGLPSPRLISNLFANQGNDTRLNLRESTSLFIYFGQFLDHDIALIVQQNEDIGESFPIPVPNNDPIFNQPFIPFTRSTFTSNGTSGVRTFQNVNTAWLDLSTVYGDLPELSRSLRLFRGGLLRTFHTQGVDLPPIQNGRFLCGDTRCQEHPILLAIHTMFLREHNRLARLFQRRFPRANDELIYQHARVVNILQYQSLVWEEYLPLVFGQRTFFTITGGFNPNPNLSPVTSLGFSQSYRFGHSGIGLQVEFLNETLQPARDPIPIQEAFFLFDLIVNEPQSIEQVLLGHAQIIHPVLDERVTDGIRNFLFQNTDPNGVGQDLVARNFQRGRDHGVQSLNFYRSTEALLPIQCQALMDCFLALTGGNVQQATQLADAYNNQFDQIDLWLAGMIESSFEDSQLGETFTFMNARQFDRFRRADRLWYQDPLLQSLFNVSYPVRMSQIMQRNFQGIPFPLVLQDQVFHTYPIYVTLWDRTRIQLDWTPPVRLQSLVQTYRVRVYPIPSNSSNPLSPLSPMQSIQVDLPVSQRFLVVPIEQDHPYLIQVDLILQNRQRIPLGRRGLVSACLFNP